MKQTFQIDIESCPKCGRGPLRCVGIVTDPDAIEALLATAHIDGEPLLQLPWARAPPAQPGTQLALPFAA